MYPQFPYLKFASAVSAARFNSLANCMFCRGSRCAATVFSRSLELPPTAPSSSRRLSFSCFKRPTSSWNGLNQVNWIIPSTFHSSNQTHRQLRYLLVQLVPLQNAPVPLDLPIPTAPLEIIDLPSLVRDQTTRLVQLMPQSIVFQPQPGYDVHRSVLLGRVELRQILCDVRQSSGRMNRAVGEEVGQCLDHVRLHLRWRRFGGALVVVIQQVVPTIHHSVQFRQVQGQIPD